MQSWGNQPLIIAGSTLRVAVKGSNANGNQLSLSLSQDVCQLVNAKSAGKGGVCCEERQSDETKSVKTLVPLWARFSNYCWYYPLPLLMVVTPIKSPASRYWMVRKQGIPSEISDDPGATAGCHSAKQRCWDKRTWPPNSRFDLGAAPHDGEVQPWLAWAHG